MSDNNNNEDEFEPIGLGTVFLVLTVIGIFAGMIVYAFKSLWNIFQ